MKIHTLLGLPVIAFALAAPVAYAAGEAGGNTPRTGSTDSGDSKAGRTVQQPAAKDTYPGQASTPVANNATQSGKKTFNDRSGGVGTGAGSSENLGSSNAGGGVNTTGSASGKP
ncbi:MAG: hypothetical protein JWN73_830 [Betaproteobacteria bacterium]|nr:hypothetical protein [Betaproteobacteria bacterium]